MRIISIRNGFTSDHSSTSYEFLAVDNKLDKKARMAVSSLSRRAAPTTRRVSFIYHVDGYDIPGGWEPLMRDYYDVMYSESYDTWTLALAFDASPNQQEDIRKYEFYGIDELGIRVENFGKRLIVSIYCRLNPPYYEDYYYDDEDDEEFDNGDYEPTDNALLGLLTRVRNQLTNGDYRALYVIWEVYKYSNDDEEGQEAPPVPPEKIEEKSILEEFRSMLITPY